tara:strand:- start:230 stop:565 length:336 start_codon:yes stop_codon:yes gene_type:complete
MGIIHFILSENGDAGQYAFKKDLFRYLIQAIVVSPTGLTSIILYFQAQGELYTHDQINLTVASPYKTVVIQQLIEDLCKDGAITIRDSSGHTFDTKSVYKHISDITHTAST